MEFTIEWALTARFDSTESSDSLSEAVKLAEQTYDSADFGCATDIEAEIRCITDSEGKEIWRSEMDISMQDAIAAYDKAHKALIEWTTREKILDAVNYLISLGREIDAIYITEILVEKPETFAKQMAFISDDDPRIFDMVIRMCSFFVFKSVDGYSGYVPYLKDTGEQLPYHFQKAAVKVPLDMSIEKLRLSYGVVISLRNAGISTVGELLNKSRKDLFRIRNIGKKAADEIEEKLAAQGLCLKTNV